MGKKDIREKKNKEVQARLVREAKIMGIKEDDPVLKQSLEAVENVKGASKGRNKILTEQLVSLGKYVKAKAKAEKTIEKQAQVVENVTNQSYTREDMEKFMEDRLNQMLEEKLSDFLKNIEDNYSKIIEEREKEVKKITFVMINNSIQNKITQIKANVVNGVVLGGATIYEGGKTVLNKTKEVAGNVKDATVETYEKAKDVVYEKVEDVKDIAGNAYDKTKDVAGNVKDATVETYEKAKDVVYEKVEDVKDIAGNAYDKTKDVAGDIFYKTKEAAYVAKVYGSKFKSSVARQKDRQINNLMSFFERTKDKTKELKDKVVGKVKSFKSNLSAVKEEFREEYKIRKDYTGAIYRNKLLNKALDSAASFRIDLDSPEAEGLKEAIYTRINYVLDNQDFYGVEDIDGAVLAQVEEIYKDYNIEIMNKQKEMNQQSNYYKQYENPTENLKNEIRQLNLEDIKKPDVYMHYNRNANGPANYAENLNNNENISLEEEKLSSFMIGSKEAGCLFETSTSGVKTARSLINGKLGIIREISEEEYENAMSKYDNYKNRLEQVKEKEKEKEHANEMGIA